MLRCCCWEGNPTFNLFGCEAVRITRGIWELPSNPWPFLPTNLTKLMQISVFSGRDPYERTTEQMEQIALLLSATSKSFNNVTAIKKKTQKQHGGMVPRSPTQLENKRPEKYLQSSGLISPGQSSAGYYVRSDVPCQGMVAADKLALISSDCMLMWKVRKFHEGKKKNQQKVIWHKGEKHRKVKKKRKIRSLVRK